MAYDQQLADALRENEALRAALAQLQQAVREYGRHSDTCAIHDCAACAKGADGHHEYVKAACDCGFEAVLRALVVPKE
jgi:hypothetical protein